MKAMVLDEIGPVDGDPLSLREVADPEPAAGEVRLRVLACAVCRTDLHVIEGDLPRQKLPIIPGHQVVGVVDRVGEGCRRLKLGDRVGIAWLRGACGRCACCQAQRENLCEETVFTGYHVDGGFAERAVVPEDFAYEIPVAFEDAEATPLLCAGIIGYRSLNRSNPRPGCRLALYGFGSSAHIVIQLARHRGCQVYVATRSAAHRELAREMGAAWVGEHPDELPEPVDSAVLFAPAGDLVPPAMAKLARGGTLAIAGIHLTDIPPLNYEKHLFYERDLRSVTCNTRADGRELLTEAAQIPIRPRVTCYPLAEANRALQDLKHDRVNGTAVLAMDRR